MALKGSAMYEEYVNVYSSAYTRLGSIEDLLWDVHGYLYSAYLNFYEPDTTGEPAGYLVDGISADDGEIGVMLDNIEKLCEKITTFRDGDLTKWLNYYRNQYTDAKNKEKK